MKRRLIQPVPFLTLGQEYEIENDAIGPRGAHLVFVEGRWYRAEFFSLAEEKLFPYILRDLLARANQVARHAGKRARWGAEQADILFSRGNDRWKGKVYLDRYFKEEERLIAKYGTKESSNVNPSCE